LKAFHALEKWLIWVDELSDKNYVVIDNFLTGSLYKTIRSFFLNHLHQFDQAGIGSLDQNQVIKGVRGDRTYWLDSQRDVTLKDFWKLVNEMIGILNRYCFLSLSGFEFHLAHYPPETFYQMHLDQFKERNNRLISVVIYLNEGWYQGDGGELCLVDRHEKKVIVEPIAMRCVLFKSADVHHEVLIANKSRYSLTGWLLYHPAAVGQLLG
jgi:SM-20-related protein